jgi:hypothetical protein
MDNKRLPFHEIDFLLPVHRFKINFSYVSKKEFPFIREFVLRLVHLSPIDAKSIAQFFGFTKNEAIEAVDNLIDLGDLEYNDDGNLKLTNQAHGYFSGLGDIPLVSSLSGYSTILGFEITDFNCLGDKRTEDKWKSGFTLDADPKQVSESEKYAKRHFQSQFYSLIDKGYLKGINDDLESSGRPSIYKIDLAKKIAQEPLRVTQVLSLDHNGEQLERDDIEQLEETSTITSKITLTIHENGKADNTSEVFLAMGLLGDKQTQSLIDNNLININKLVADRANNEVSDSDYLPFLGPVYSKHNWQLFSKFLDNSVKRLAKKHLDGIDKLIWIAPSDSFWGKSLRLESCFGELVRKSKISGEKKKSLYKPTIYVPVSDNSDRRSKGEWGRNLSRHIKNVHGLVEGFLHGNVEVIVLPEQFAVVCYHISMPDSYDVSMPLGFITTDRKMVMDIGKMASEYISGSQGHDLPNDISCI